MTTNKDIFLLANCFNNYEIVSSKIIQFYITNSLNNGGKVKTYFEDTPFALYSVNMNPGTNISNSSKQYQMFIIILALAAVSLARVYSSSCTVYINNGVVDIAGFSTLFGIANVLNKPTVCWNDDMRSTWGVSTDPLVLATRPIFYRNLYGASTASSSGDTKPYIKNLNNSSLPPTMGTDVKCSSDNVFIDMIKESTNVSKQWNESLNLDNNYIGNLILIGNKIINYVEGGKNEINPNSPLGWNLGVNSGLYYDLSYVILEESNNKSSLLSREQIKFIKDNNKDFNGEIKISPLKKQVVLGDTRIIHKSLGSQMLHIQNGSIPSSFY